MKAIRRPLFWFHLSMWVVSLLIAGFLIQLGSLILSDLPRAGTPVDRADFVDTAALDETEAEIAALSTRLQSLSDRTEDASLLLQARRQDLDAARTSFDAWLRTRTATGDADQDAALLERTQAIEALRAEQREAERRVAALRAEVLQAERALSAARQDRAAIQAAAAEPYERALALERLKIFALRLALTLPLLAISGWLALKKRQSTYWPVYRGFILFSLFAFFFELVPYLPSYGGYVRAGVGILLALAVAHVLIRGMTRYLARKRAEETRSEAEKRRSISYETALKKMADGTCPACDRSFVLPVKRGKPDETPARVDYCIHCGFNLYRSCDNCGARENSFFPYCGTCGTRTPAADGPSALA